MNKILCTISMIVLLFPMVTFAQKVSEEQAREKAKEFFLNMSSGDSAIPIRKALGQAGESMLTLASQDSMYYVFNVGESQGFVIVSGDERTTSVLGYADKGQFVEDNLPKGLKQLLQQYQSEIKMINEMGVIGITPRSVEENKRPAIEPLLRTAWGQNDPYNRMCPEQSVTGCVATAAAQIMDFHHWPAATTATIPGYTSDTSQYEIPDLEPSAFDWELIAKHEKGMEEQITNESRGAVAKLMFYIGASVTMDYTTWESGSSHYDLLPALQQYFDYDAYLLERNAQSSLFWDDILYNELAHGRPMLYVGSINSLQSSHAFVCDGYDGEGRYHFDWGWNGEENGYFVPTAIPINAWVSRWPVDGFSVMQCIVGGIRPKGTVLAEDDRMQELLDAVENYIPQSTEFLSVEKVEVENGIDFDLLHVTLHNSGTEDFDDQFFVYGSHILGAGSVDCRYMRIPAGESATTDFYAYGGNTTFTISTNSGFYATADAQLWKDEKNSYFVFANGEDIVIPENVSAAYLSCDLMRVTPNSNPNTLYYTYEQEIQQDFEDKNVVLDSNSENITLNNSYAFIVPFDITVSHVKMKASVSTLGANALTIPFDTALPDGVTAMQYNYNDEGHAYFVPVSRINANGLFLVSSDKEYVEFAATNVDLQGINKQGVGLFPLTHLRTYGDIMENVYVYDATKNSFVKESSIETKPFSFVFAANENSNLADVVEVAESSENPFASLDYEVDMFSLPCGTYTIDPDDPYQFVMYFYGGFKDSPFIPTTAIGLSQDGQFIKSLYTLYSNNIASIWNFNSVPDGTFEILPFYQVFTGGIWYPAEISNSYDITKEGNTVTLKGHFVYNVETVVEGEQGGTINQMMNGKVKENTVLHLEAQPDEGWRFVKWIILDDDYYQERYEPVLDYVVNSDAYIIAVFSINQYTITFDTDGGSEVEPITLDYGSEIVKPADPVKEGYTFAGWDQEIPETMPAENITIKALWTTNSYKLTYMIDGEVVSESDVEYGSPITPLDEPTKVGYTFSGWSDIPETMPAHDVEVNGSFAVNQYCVRYYVFDELVHKDEVTYGDTYTLYEYTPEEDYIFNGWVGEIYETMPAHDVEYHADITSGISNPVLEQEAQCYDLLGRKQNVPRRHGITVQRRADGSYVKVIR